MAIDCDIEPQLHIPHISVPYNDQKLMENFQAIQRWADRLHINCEGCDCETGDWTITPDAPRSETGITSSYIFDGDYSLLTVHVAGEVTSGTANFSVYKNGSPIVTEPLSGTFDNDITVDATFTSGDEIYFAWDLLLNESTLLFDGYHQTGHHPIAELDPIGSTENYLIHVNLLDNDIGPGNDLGEDEKIGFGTDTTFDDDPYGYALDVGWSGSGTPEAWAYTRGGTTNFLAHDWRLEAAEFRYTITGEGPVNVTLGFNPDGTSFGGFNNQVIVVTNPGGGTDTGVVSYDFEGVYPVFTTTMEQPFDSVPVFQAIFEAEPPAGTLTSFTANLSPDKADEVVTWLTGGG